MNIERSPAACCGQIGTPLAVSVSCTARSHIARRGFRAVGLAAGVATAACVAVVPAFAQGRVEAQFEVTLAGLQIGKGGWVVDIADDQYSTTASGKTTGLVSMMSTGFGNGGSQGRVVKGQLVPSSYTFQVTTNKKSELLRMDLAGGHVKDFSIEPEPPANPDRVPLTDAHKRNVIDPLTASLMRVPGTGDPLSSDACARGVPVFDGRIRYDLKLEYKRLETVKLEKGPQIPAVVCAVYFSPIAGHVPDRSAIKYLIAQRNMEVSLALIPGTRVLMPVRLVIPTPVGVGVLRATQIAASPQPRPALPAALVRTQ